MTKIRPTCRLSAVRETSGWIAMWGGEGKGSTIPTPRCSFAYFDAAGGKVGGPQRSDPSHHRPENVRMHPPRSGESELPQHAEALRFDPQRDVELAAEILQGDGGGELDDLRLAEVLADAGEELVGHALASDRHGLGVGDGVALHLVEQRAGGGLVDRADLVLAGAVLHPPGCVDVHSERTAV